MPWTSDSQNGQNGPRRNPWGQGGGGQGGGPRGPHNGPSGSGQGGPAPDFDDILRRARASFEGGGFPNGKRGLMLGLVMAVAIWLGSGVFRVSPGENAVIQVFGALSTVQTTPGLGYHLPWPIGAVSMLNVTLDRRVSIGFTETGRNTRSVRGFL